MGGVKKNFCVDVRYRTYADIVVRTVTKSPKICRHNIGMVPNIVGWSEKCQKYADVYMEGTLCILDEFDVQVHM